MTARAQGWYRDPDDPSRHRWWTGEEWQTQDERFRAVRRCPHDTRTGDDPVTDLD